MSGSAPPSPFITPCLSWWVEFNSLQGLLRSVLVLSFPCTADINNNNLTSPHLTSLRNIFQTRSQLVTSSCKAPASAKVRAGSGVCPLDPGQLPHVTADSPACCLFWRRAASSIYYVPPRHYVRPLTSLHPASFLKLESIFLLEKFASFILLHKDLYNVA